MWAYVGIVVKELETRAVVAVAGLSVLVVVGLRVAAVLGRLPRQVRQVAH